MQTGESLYALSLAGLGPDDPAMRRGILALLTRQQPFGGWFDVNPYEQFRTPFRETQWALIALSTIYPDPKPLPTGWNQPPRPEPDRLRTDDPAALLIATSSASGTSPAPSAGPGPVAQLDASLAAGPVRRLPGAGTGRPDASAIDGLAGCLGDETKVVRRAAAEALRSIGNRLNGREPARRNGGSASGSSIA